MMDYLKNYNITDSQINILSKAICEFEGLIDTFKYEPEKVMSILDMFTSIGVTDIYSIIITNPTMFADTVDSVKNRINSFEDKQELARLLNEDSNNLSLVGLL